MPLLHQCHLCHNAAPALPSSQLFPILPPLIPHLIAILLPRRHNYFNKSRGQVPSLRFIFYQIIFIHICVRHFRPVPFFLFFFFFLPVSHFQDNGGLFWDVEDQKQRFLNPYGFTNSH